jgi:hypothetical protein
MAQQNSRQCQHPRLIGRLYPEVNESLLGIGPERSAGGTYEHEVNVSRLHCVPEQEWGRVMDVGTPLCQNPVLLTLRSKLKEQVKSQRIDKERYLTS